MAAFLVMRYRIRATRETAHSGDFAWAALDAAGAALASGRSALALPPGRGACEVVIPAELVLLRRVEVAPAQRKRLAGALRFVVEDSLACDPDEVHVAQSPAAPPDSLCLAIVDRPWLRAVLARVEAAGFAPRRALAETLLPPLEPGAWVVVWNGAESFVRTAEYEGFALDNPLDGSMPVALRLALQAAPPRKIVMRSAVPEPWMQALGVPVDMGPPWHWTEPNDQRAFDLLQGEHGAQDHGRWRRPALVAAALVAVAGAGLGLQWALEAAERRTLTTQMHALYRETFGPQAPIVDAPLQMQRALALLRQKSGLPAPSDFLPLLERLARELPPEGAGVATLSYAHGRLALVLRDGRRLEAAAQNPAPRNAAALPLATLRAELEDMRSMREEIEGLRRTRVAAARTPPPAGKRSAARVAFADWLELVASLQRDFGLRLESCEIAALAEPGMVRVEASFAAPP